MVKPEDDKVPKAASTCGEKPRAVEMMGAPPDPHSSEVQRMLGNMAQRQYWERRLLQCSWLAMEGQEFLQGTSESIIRALVYGQPQFDDKDWDFHCWLFSPVTQPLSTFHHHIVMGTMHC